MQILVGHVYLALWEDSEGEQWLPANVACSGTALFQTWDVVWVGGSVCACQGSARGMGHTTLGGGGVPAHNLHACPRRDPPLLKVLGLFSL